MEEFLVWELVIGLIEGVIRIKDCGDDPCQSLVQKESRRREVFAHCTRVIILRMETDIFYTQTWKTKVIFHPPGVEELKTSTDVLL